jgi:hypothetical protein
MPENATDSNFDSDNPQVEPPAEVTKSMFLEWRSPRFGRRNPDRMNNRVWEWLIKSGLQAYPANKKFNGPDSTEAGPCWCFARYGQTLTVLPDGRKVMIAGEHEDYYDADFYIYNDVVVLHPSGEVEIFGYPKDIFPPTDFHTATLMGSQIILIGSLGYSKERRHGATPVYLLNINDFTISPQSTTGDQPGWIHKHSAALSETGSILVKQGMLERNTEDRTLVENIDDWSLNLSNWRWERLTDRRWQRWEARRKDGKMGNLWQINMAIQFPRQEDLESLTQKIGIQPNLELAATLYRPNISHEPLPDREEDWRVHRIMVDGVVVRYNEGSSSVVMTVEGTLSPQIIESLTTDLVRKLRILENVPYELQQL